ncbi:hypothetical protein D3C80_1092320 [compost metagenome]
MNDYLYPILWWNTSLSPPISSKRGVANNDKKKLVALVLEKFMNIGYEFICLGEVSQSDLDFFDMEISPQSLGYYCAKGVEKSGRVYFDTCIYYKKTNTLIRHGNTDVKNFEMYSSTRTFKYGQKYTFQLSLGDVAIIYLSHWPSKRNDVYLKLTSIAERLRIDVEVELALGRKVIMMGDYNVEPYHDALVHHLQSSREKELVLNKAAARVLYNPCWKFLSSIQNSSGVMKEGTYYYPSGAFNRWYTIDQVLFSHGFLVGDWELKDEHVKIIDIDLLMTDCKNGLSPNVSDHLPISAILTRKLP